MQHCVKPDRAEARLRTVCILLGLLHACLMMAALHGSGFAVMTVLLVDFPIVYLFNDYSYEGLWVSVLACSVVYPWVLYRLGLWLLDAFRTRCRNRAW